MSAFTFEEICSRHDVWLHMEGHALAGLALLDTQSKGTLEAEKEESEEARKVVRNTEPPVGDSLSLTLGSWLGIPALPFVTLYKVKPGIYRWNFCLPELIITETICYGLVLVAYLII